MDKFLLERLQKAKSEIIKAFNANDTTLMGTMAKKLQPLHQECFDLWANRDFPQKCKEYHYAEYLHKLIMLHFEHLFDYGGDTEGLHRECKVHMWKAGLIPNEITGKFIDED